MFDRPSTALQYGAGLGVILAIGIASLAVHAWHLVGEAEMPVNQLLLGGVFPTAISLLLVGAGVWFHRQDCDPKEMLRVGSWVGMGFLVFVWVGGGALLYFAIQDMALYDPAVVMMTIGSAGALAGTLVGRYDVKSHRASRQLRSQRDEAQQLSERLRILTRVFRHDIRTELTVILGQARLAKTHCDETAEPYLQTLLERAETVEQVSEQARTIQATVDRATTRTEQDVCPMIHSVREELEDRNPGTTITVTGPGRAVVTASVELRTALEEVLENAVEHGNPNGIEVTVEVTDSTVEIAVCDSGPGIPPEEVEILESAVETPLQHSSGLGLWTVKWIVEASEGTFEVERVDSGTQVLMAVPRAESA